MQLLPLEESRAFSQITSCFPIFIRKKSNCLLLRRFFLNTMIPNYLTGVIYGCLVEAYASENNARMMAMQSSTDSAKYMLQGAVYSV